MASLLSVPDCFGAPFWGCMLWDVNSSLMDFFFKAGETVFLLF